MDRTGRQLPGGYDGSVYIDSIPIQQYIRDLSRQKLFRKKLQSCQVLKGSNRSISISWDSSLMKVVIQYHKVIVLTKVRAMIDMMAKGALWPAYCL